MSFRFARQNLIHVFVVFLRRSIAQNYDLETAIVRGVMKEE